MNEQQIRAYVRTLKFWLKDFEKTNNKHKDYKTEKRKELDVSINVQELVDDGVRNIYNSSNSYYRNALHEANTKSEIRMCKTGVNSFTYEAIKNHIDWYTDNTLNENELKNFTTRAYLEHYEEFNDEMLEQLENCLCGTE